MGSLKPPSVAVIYNFPGEDEYETPRQKVQNGEVASPPGDIKDLARIATVQEEIDALVKGLQKEGFDARGINVEDDFGRLLKSLTSPRPDVVFNLVNQKTAPKLMGLRYPLIIKPAWEDASVGVTERAVVEDRAQLENRVRMILAEYKQPVLVEEFIEGRELAVSVMGNRSPRVLPVEG